MLFPLFFSIDAYHSIIPSNHEIHRLISLNFDWEMAINRSNL